MRHIDIQDIDCGATASRQADQMRPIPRKVSNPSLPTPVEQDHDTAGDGIAPGQVAGFAQIALKARPSEIV